MFKPGTDDLFAAITENGFYPGVMKAGIRQLLGSADVRCYLTRTDVHLDDEDGVQMEGQAVAVTDSRVVFWGAFEQPGEEGEPAVLHTHSRVFPLSRVNDVRIFTEVSNPAEFDEGNVPDLVRLVIVMDHIDHMDLDPIHCDDDENCGGGHGMRGEVIHDALMFHETREAVGEDKLRELLTFGAELSDLLAARR